MKLPDSLQNLIDFFEQLPGIGPKTAARLTFYLWQTPNHFVEQFARSLLDLKKKTKQCSVCFNLDAINPCRICSGQNRDKSVICVVEKPLDVIAFEKMGGFNGVYHILGGVINPLDHIGPEDLHIDELIKRIAGGEIKEVILATNPTMEGEATASYIARKILEIKNVIITMLGKGLPTGADIDYADSWTIKQSWENRREIR